MTNARGTPSRLMIVLAFLSVYFCWSATYTAMRVGVSLLPATVLAGVRLLIGAGIMLGFCALRGRKILFTSYVMWRLMLLGVMLLFGGNIGLVWSEKYLPSGLAALIVAVVPLYVVLIEMVLPDGDRLRKQGYIGLGLGFCALGALLWPSLRAGIDGHPMQVLAIVAILLGALSWASGSVLSRRMGLPVDPLVAAGWEMFAAGATNVILATLFRQWPHAVWNLKSEGCVGYLVLFGSLLGFSCYIWLIAHVPVAKVATYAYVNPMIAVVLGALILHEKLVSTEYAGMVAIIVSVALVTSSKLSSGKSTAEVECAPVETEA
ncbi:MAG TPA: EamA family transporter [Acidobacteriaceae bacterium]|nr:EamA family transporter [Acidobacteriaceae bacterium]